MTCARCVEGPVLARQLPRCFFNIAAIVGDVLEWGAALLKKWLGGCFDSLLNGLRRVNWRARTAKRLDVVGRPNADNIKCSDACPPSGGFHPLFLSLELLSCSITNFSYSSVLRASQKNLCRNCLQEEEEACLECSDCSRCMHVDPLLAATTVTMSIRRLLRQR